jgi:hypothetical protein
VRNDGDYATPGQRRRGSWQRRAISRLASANRRREHHIWSKTTGTCEGDLLTQAATAVIGRFQPAQEVIPSFRTGRNGATGAVDPG